MAGWEYTRLSGGMGVHCRNLAGNLRQKNRVYFFCPSKNKFVANRKNMKIFGMKCEAFGGDLLNGKKLKERFDIVHAHDWMSFATAKSMAKRCLISTLHSLEYMRSRIPDQTIEEIERDMCHESDAIITVSGFMKDEICRKYGIARKRVHVIPNSVNIKKEVQTADKKTILFVGRLTYQKGPEYFVMAAKEVLNENKDTRFVMVGDGFLRNRLHNPSKITRI